MTVINDIVDFIRRAALEFAIEDLDDSFGDIGDRLDDASLLVALEAKAFWQAEAGRTLNTTRLRYQSTIYISEDFTGNKGIFVAMSEQDPLILNIEQGADSYDLKPGLLAGRDSRIIPIKPFTQMPLLTRWDSETSWIHPGFVGLDLAGETDAYIDEVLIPKHLEELFGNL